MAGNCSHFRPRLGPVSADYYDLEMPSRAEARKQLKIVHKIALTSERRAAFIDRLHVLSKKTLIFGSYIGEDALGGAKNDYLFHEKFIISFYQNFNEALNEFGKNYEVRNSPVFFIIASFFLKIGINEEILNRLWSALTCFVSIISFFYFSKTITRNNFYSILVSLIFLSHKFINTHYYSIHYPVSFFYIICIIYIHIFI